MRRVCAIASLVFALTAFTTPATAQTPNPAPKKKQITHADILTNFEIIAFGAEYSGRKYDYVRKWQNPVVIGIQGITTPEFEQIVSSTMNRLRKLTKHRIEIRYSHGMKKAGYLPKDFDIRKAGINTVIYFYPRKILARKMAPNFAGAELRRNPGQKKQILQRVENDINRLINISTCFANIKFAVKHQPKALKGTIKAALIGVPAGLSPRVI